MQKHQTIKGRIHYTSDKEGRVGVERGREYWTITKHTDGRRTLRSQAEIDDPPPVLRDVVQTVDADWVPRESFVRIAVDDVTVGSAWFRFTDTYSECEGFTSEEGRISQRFEHDRPPRIFGSHPIQGDAWHLNIVDLEKTGLQEFDHCMMSSLDHRGATGPYLVKHGTGLRLEFLGREEITVAAGTFDALHFCFGDKDNVDEGANEPGRHPPYHVWTTSDGEYIMLLAYVTGYMKTRYECVELDYGE
jgi:hypothetical protein